MPSEIFRGRRVAAELRRLQLIRVRKVENIPTCHQARARRQLVIESQPRQVRSTRAGELDVEAGIWRIDRERLRLALVFVIGEVVEPVPEDGPAVGRAKLLIRIWEDVPGDEVGSVEGVVAEVAGKRSCRYVGARFGNGVHLNAGRAPLGGVEPARQELKLGDRIATEPRLT